MKMDFRKSKSQGLGNFLFPQLPRAKHKRGRLSAFLALMMSCALLFSTSNVRSYNVYYQNDYDPPVIDNPQDLFPDGSDAMLWAMSEVTSAVQGFQKDTLPAAHEALVYRAIGKICGSDLGGCWINDAIFNEVDPTVVGTFDMDGVDQVFEACALDEYYIDIMTEDADDTAPNCNLVGRNGLSNASYGDIVAGARYTDLKGYVGLGVNGPFMDWAHSPNSVPRISPSGHTLIDNDLARVDPLQIFEDIPDWDEELADHLVERMMLIDTATASFVIDRFLQAEREVADAHKFEITNAYTVNQDMSFFWEFPCTAKTVAAQAIWGECDLPNWLEIELNAAGGYATTIETACRVQGETCALCMAGWIGARWQDLVEGDFESTEEDRSELIAACGLPCTGGKLLEIIDWFPLEFFPVVKYYTECKDQIDDWAGEQMDVFQRPFMLGQGIHTIGDAFAHLIREDAGRIAQFRRSDANEELAEIGTEGDVRWMKSHSDCYDHDCKFGGGPESYNYNKYVDDFFYLDDGNALGDLHRQLSAEAVADYLAIWELPTFKERWSALETFIRQWFTIVIPQEIYVPNEDGQYAYNNISGRMCTDTLPESVEGPVCATGSTCDTRSGICRSLCLTDDGCRTDLGFKCGEEGTVGAGTCYKEWDPWDLVADEYFIGVQEEWGNMSSAVFEEPKRFWDYDEAGHKREPYQAREWYKTDFYDGQKAADRFRELEESSQCQASPVIMFTGRGYTGDARCINPTESGGTPTEGSQSIGGIKSIYVAPGYRACFTMGSDSSKKMCLYGGINGTAEPVLMPPLASHDRYIGSEDSEFKSVTWEIIDIDQDGVNDKEDNCRLIHNEPVDCSQFESIGIAPPSCCFALEEEETHCQPDLDGDGFGDQCDHDIDGDGVLEDGDGAWARGNGDDSDNCVAGATENCDDNCAVIPYQNLYEVSDKLLYTFPEDEKNEMDKEYCEFYIDRFNGEYAQMTQEGDFYRVRYTKNNYQEDLDRDGIGDVCDEDRDGDSMKNVPCEGATYSFSKIVGTTPAPNMSSQVNVYGIGEGEVPAGQIDCNDFLWTVNWDYDQDGHCDFYRFYTLYTTVFIDPTNGEQTEFPDYSGTTPCLDDECSLEDFLMKGGGVGSEAVEDYLMSSYRIGEDGYGGSYEGGGNHYDGSSMGERAYHSFKWCKRNVEAVRHHYNIVTDEDGNPSYVGEEPNDSFLANMNDFGDAAWEFDTFNEGTFVFDGCRMDNCIRHAKGDALTGFLCNDDFDNDGTPDGMSSSNPFFAEHWGTVWKPQGNQGCDSARVRFQPSLADAIQADPSWEHNLYTLYFTNPHQMDSDHNGVGDMCESIPAMNNFEQDTTVEDVEIQAWSVELFESDYPIIPCEEEYILQGYEWCDEETGFPVVVGPNEDGSMPEPLTVVDGQVFEDLCECGSGLVPAGDDGNGNCILMRHVSSAVARLSFDTQGFAIAGPNPYCTPPLFPGLSGEIPGTVADDYLDYECQEGYKKYSDDLFASGEQKMTFGACACDYEGFDGCFAPGGKCENRTEDSNVNPPQFDEFLNPKYKHHKQNFSFSYNNSKYLDKTLAINDRCQTQTAYVALDGYGEGGGLNECYWVNTSTGWDLGSNDHDGCERITMDFQSKVPDPDDIPGAGSCDFFKYVDGSEIDYSAMNHREMDWRYLNEPRYWQADEFDPDGNGLTPNEYDTIDWDWEDEFPFAGRYASQWAAWSPQLDEDDKVTAWFKVEYANEEEYKDSNEANYVWYTNDCGIPVINDQWVDYHLFVHIYDMVTSIWHQDSSLLKNVVEKVHLRKGENGHVFDGLQINLMNGKVKEKNNIPAPGFKNYPAAIPSKDYSIGAGAYVNKKDEPTPFQFVFGGLDAGGRPSNALWVEETWGNGEWHLASYGNEGPQPLTDAKVVFDMGQQRIVVLGGLDYRGSWSNDVWAYYIRENAWKQLGTKLVPEYLEDYELAIDAQKGVVWLFGGHVYGKPSSELFSMELSSLKLSQVRVKGSMPPAREYRSAMYHPNRDTIIVHGGTDGRTYYSDIWEFTPSKNTWSNMLPEGSYPGLQRSGAAMIPSANSDTVFVIGGKGSWGEADITKSWELTPGRLPIVVDSEPKAVIRAGGGAWIDTLTPGHMKQLYIGHHKSYKGVANYLNVHIEIPTDRLIDMEIFDSKGKMVGRTTAKGGQGVASISAQGDEQYWVALNNWDGQGSMDYTIWIKEASRVTKSASSSFAVGGAKVKNDLAFVAAEQQLEVYRDDGDNLTQVASLNTEYARDVVVEKNTAYIAAGDRGLVVVDISTPEAPIEIGSATAIGYAKRLVKNGNEIYVAAGQYGVMVFDVSEPTSPQWIETIATDVSVEDVAVGNSLLVIAKLTGEVELRGLRKEKRHQLLATVEASNWIKDVTVRGTHLFVLLATGSVEEYEVGSLRRIKLVGTHDESEMAVSGHIDSNSQMTTDSGWLSGSVKLHRFEDVD